MNSLGFKNFRKFVELKPLEFKGITFLVGRNNAGKSTFVRALILILEYLKSNQFGHFPLSSQLTEDFNITSFGRAKNVTNKGIDAIEFNLTLDHFSIKIIISALDDAKIANVHHLIIKDIDTGFEFKFKPLEESVEFSKSVDDINNKLNEDLEKYISDLKSEVKRIRTELKEIDAQAAPKLHAEKKTELAKQNKAIKALSTFQNNGYYKKESYNVASYIEPHYSLERAINGFIEENTDYYYEELQHNKEQDDIKTVQAFRSFASSSVDIKDAFEAFFKILKRLSYRYLGSYSSKQAALLFIKDKNNALSQAVDDFYQKKINPGEIPYEFIRTWMEILEVGNDFKITPHLGEAYEVKITDNNKSIDLADKGMGSIQIMLLLFRLAAIIHLSLKDSKNLILFIEEPELNLHPALQSKLADLFLEVNKKYGIRFIIETHSEYILRRSQVLVAENDYEIAPNENPFSVYYFNTEPDKQPYQLKYQSDGTFDKNFGEGFFDAAASSTLELLKIMRIKKGK